MVEMLLVSDDAVDSARRCLEWLSRHAQLRAGLCLVATQDDTARLVPVASHGLGAEVNGFAVDLEERDHPLVGVAFGLHPTAFSQAELQADPRLVTPLGHVPYHVFPLHALDSKDEPPVGLLIATRVPAAQDGELRWATQIL